MKKKNLTSLLILGSLASVHAHEKWTVTTQEDWEKAKLEEAGIEIKDGTISPTEKQASFQSQLKRFPEKRAAHTIKIEQSATWLNWKETKNIGTKSMRDAPVLLSLGPGNYWMFAKYADGSASKKQRKNKKKRTETPPLKTPASKFKPQPASLEGYEIPLLTTPLANEFTAPGGLKPALGGYHAWQSKDMVNWVRHGSVTPAKGKWMTTAEYVDGKFYFYYDFPNDQDPHVYVDEDLTDGVPGEDMGMALKDPSHGSDCAIIRDREGKFHLIYENWDPILAKKRSWDSPLAGHAVSDDGIKDFKILAPAVDERTTPTGKQGTYEHPHWVKEDPANYKTNTATYEIHEPEQKAYGDWASIAIGGQYYLFGDYDPSHGAEMSVAWFTSSSLDKQFKFCGNIGQGHPDPDVCFAEGKFYLATQQPRDFVSSGPWVETVEVRVGVDTSNDGKVNEWSKWQILQESYDYEPGFVKHVKKTPAQMDLSSLPEGYGFQFELKISDSTENESKPVIDQVELSFAP